MNKTKQIRRESIFYHSLTTVVYKDSNNQLRIARIKKTKGSFNSGARYKNIQVYAETDTLISPPKFPKNDRGRC